MKINDSEVKKLASKFNLAAKNIPISEFKKGIRVEMEHGPKNKGGVSSQTNVTKGSLAKTAKIALAHLEEDRRYYKALSKMEHKLERTKKNGKKKNGKKSMSKIKKSKKKNS
jgi:hypothetical protein